MTSRNAPCPCGSGKKFKRCHGFSLRSGQDEAAPSQVSLSGTARRSDRNTADSGFWHQLVVAHLGDARLDDAWTAFHHAQELLPSEPGTHYLHGVLLQLSGRPSEALDAYAEAIHIGTHASKAYPRNTKALSAAAALQMFETAAGNYPGSRRTQPQGMFDCGPELAALENHLLDWERELRSGGQIPLPEHARRFATGWYNLGCAALAAFTRDDRRVHLFGKALELNPDDARSRVNCAFALNYSFMASPGEIFEEHRETGEWLENRFGRPAGFSPATRKSNERIRLAYLSSDFREHSVAHFILPVLEQHDRSKFEIFLYYNHSREDDYTRRSRLQAEHFRQIHHLADESLREVIKADGIDILIDLNGLTEHHRMEVLAMRAAPIQIHWLGYPNTTGLKTVDYRIVDAITDPDPLAAKLSTEQLLYLPRSFSVYQPPVEFPDVTESPFLTTGHITFGSFNSLPKLNEPLLGLWCEILRRTPGSTILLKNAAFGHSKPRQQVTDAFTCQGIEAGRVELMGADPGKREHMQSVGRVDIALDSFPYNGTTTICDSLIMGIPVVTRAGSEHRSRVGASLLTAVQLESLVARDEIEYIEIASRLAMDSELLLSLRAGLRERVQASSMMDAKALTRELELKLEKVWASWCQQE